MCHYVICRDLDHHSLPQDITLVHYTNDMLIEPGDQVATTLNLLKRHLCIRGLELNLRKYQEPSTSVKFPEVQWYGACQDIPSMVKDNLFFLGPPTTIKKRHNS